MAFDSLRVSPVLAGMIEPQPARRPFLVVVGGRGRVGKTMALWALGNTLAQDGVEFQVWDCDPSAGPGGLHRYFAGAQKCRALQNSEDQRVWLEERLAGWFASQRPTLLDLGPDDRLIPRLGATDELDLVREMDRQGKPMVMLHVVGPNVDDLRYFEWMEERLELRPGCAVLMLNAGMVSPLTREEDAFAAVLQRPSVVQFQARGGGRVGRLPRLAPELVALIEASPERSLADWVKYTEKSPDGRGVFHALRIRAFLGQMAALRESLPEHLP